MESTGPSIDSLHDKANTEQRKVDYMEKKKKDIAKATGLVISSTGFNETPRSRIISQFE